MARTRFWLVLTALVLAPLCGVRAGAGSSQAGETVLAQGGGEGMRGMRDGKRLSIDDRQKEMEKQFEEMIKYLGLDEKQLKEARALFKDRQDKVKSLFGQMKDGKVDRMAMRDTMREIGGDFREKFDKLLTEEQRKKHEQWSREHARGGFGGAEIPGGGDN
ncbi:hypothetical protein LLH00_03905 [bacterium]|nr:hypothetical protein [bacterium]